MGGPTRSYAIAGIALRVSGALKPHHDGKVETPSVGGYSIISANILTMLRSRRRKPAGSAEH
jgi:hypothetical protein